MAFDEDLHRTFTQLADRLRDEVARSLETATGELKTAIDADRITTLEAAVRDAREAADRESADRWQARVAEAESRGREAGLAVGREAGLHEGREAGLREGREAGATSSVASAATERLADAIRIIDGSRSLSEVIDALAIAAGRETARVAVLLVRGEQLQGWRFIGFGPAFDAANNVELSLDDAGLITEAVRNGKTMLSGSAAEEDGTTASAPPAFAALPSARRSAAVPISVGGQVVAVLYGDQGNAELSEAEPREAWAAALEILTRHAARSLEAITAFRSAQILTDVRETPAASRSTGVGNSPPPDKPEDDPEAARRYARLLISEIRLYHESAVMAGRRERDLARRLSTEIARARTLYEQRVPAHIRNAGDHFQAELVRTLANGDATLLGQSQ